MSNTINMTAVCNSLDTLKLEALQTISRYSSTDRAEASRIASLYDNCDKTSVKHLCDTAEVLFEYFVPAHHDSEFITWAILDGAYCADGDGLVVVSRDGAVWSVADQGDTISTHSTLDDALTAGETHLSANYPAIFEDAMHFNDAPDTDEQRKLMNFFNGHGHLN